jgi:protein-S-isoprenylcysteine O-methyltransferase Ste14
MVQRTTIYRTDIQPRLYLAAILLSLAGAIIRAFTIGTTARRHFGRNTDKQVAEQLNVTGIYSVVRHPLYLEII